MSAAAALWDPRLGGKLRALMERTRLGVEDQVRVQAETLRILGRCRPPEWDVEGTSAELVVGAVQSGKTLSFTGLIAAARDNGYPLVVVLAGTKTNLRDQTFERLVQDLAMNGDGGLPSWSPMNDLRAGNESEIVERIKQWQSNRRLRERVTTVAVVLKNHSALRRAREVLTRALRQVPGAPVLIIDDEADQAGLNVAGRAGAESSTYRAIRLLRETAPNHSYVLYTATPQAPLLITLEDSLSPRTVSVLQTGPEYVGGPDLFGPDAIDFVREIDDDALDEDSVSPPGSLQRAIATFLLAMVVAQDRGRPRPLTMLIHPSSGKDLHDAYDRWVQSIKARLVLELVDGDDVLRAQAVEDVFAPAYEDLRATSGTVVDGVEVPLDDLVDALAEGFLEAVRIRVVNSDKGNEIGRGEWTQAPGWIVIGGNKLDRGFTIENLAVTYMPRGPGVGNADTVQQRGRFFGYKRSYSDLLRAWLNSGTADAFRHYVKHEDAMWESLAALDRDGRELKTWRRAILLDSSLSPTRRAVITLDVDDVQLAGWVLTQTHVYGSPAGPTAAGRSVLDGLRATASADARDRRPGVRNVVVRTSWSVLVEVLADWRAAADEKDRLYAILLALGTLDGDTAVDVIFMNSGATRDRGPSPVSRDVLVRSGWVLEEIDDVEALEIANLMQGPDPADGSTYPGDRQFVSHDAVTLQIHELAVETSPGGRTRATSLAVHLPTVLRDRVILQTAD